MPFSLYLDINADYPNCFVPMKPLPPLDTSLLLPKRYTDDIVAVFKVLDRTMLTHGDGEEEEPKIFVVACPGRDVRSMVERLAAVGGSARVWVHQEDVVGGLEVIPYVLARGRSFWVEIAANYNYDEFDWEKDASMPSNSSYP
jgi:hypothetical protein